MAAKIITNFILIISLSVVQIAFISGLPDPYYNLNLALVVLIFILGFGGFNLAAWWSLVLGFMLEIFSFLPFGTYLIGLIITMAMAGFLLDYFFTNRSLYSFLALTALATIAYKLNLELITWIFSGWNNFIVLGSLNFWLSILKQIGLNLVLTFLFFYFIHFLGRSFKPAFLAKAKK